MKKAINVDRPTIENKADIFGDEWWKRYLCQTESLTKTSVFHNCLTEAETTEMRKYVLEIIDELSKLRTNKYGYRVFVEGKKIDDEDMKKIYDSPPSKYNDVNHWVKNTFGDKKFGVIINKGERFNLALSKMIALKTAPLLKRIGYPQEGINFSLFIGNYGWTPLGIHQDKPGENVTHFHLGPGSKIMYTWKKDKFEKLVDINNFDRHDIDPLIPFATKFKFKEGDLYYMPTGEWHIGYSKDLSLSVTFWTYNHTKSRFARRLHQMIVDQFLNNDTELIYPDKNDLSDSSKVDNILQNFHFEDGLEELTYKDLLTEMYIDLRYSISSNAGYKTSPFPKEDNFNLSKEDFVELDRPYKINHRESLNK